MIRIDITYSMMQFGCLVTFEIWFSNFLTFPALFSVNPNVSLSSILHDILDVFNIVTPFHKFETGQVIEGSKI